MRRQATPGGLLLSFDSLYGQAYDAGMNVRPLAEVGLGVAWGADGPRLFRMLEANAACSPGEVVLDCPSGGGTAFAAAAGAVQGRLVAVDLSHAMLRRADARRASLGLTSTVDLVRGDATRLPLADASVDRVCCFMGLHCIPAQAAVLREFRRILKPRGQLAGATLCADPPPPWDLAVEVALGAADFFTPPREAELEGWAGEAGFDWRQDRTGAMLYFTAVCRGGPER